MGTVWTGVLLAIGLTIGFVVIVFAVRLILGIWGSIEAMRFVRAGCVYQPSGAPGRPAGWLIRDVRNDDWVLWDERNKAALRVSDDAGPEERWHLSDETRRQFLTLARAEKAFWAKRESSSPVAGEADPD